MPLDRGFFIAFEGGEGAGKSTQIRRIESHLRSQGYDVLLTFEPGGTPLGERIRALLLDPGHQGMDPRCEALLYAAARAEHVHRVIQPALERGAIVLSDRYVDASKAYQGCGRGLGIGPIETLNEWATQSLRADRVYLFDADPRIGLQRARERTQGALDRLEQESLTFHEQIRKSYLFMAQANPSRYHILDASLDRETLFQSLLSDLKKHLPRSP